MNNDIITGSMIKLSSEVFLCTGENNPNIHLIDPKTSGILETYSAEAKIAKNGIVVSERFGDIIAHQSEKTILLYFNMLNKKPFIRASLPEKLISSCFSPDEYYFYGGSQSGLVYVWDCVTGHLLHKFQAHHKSTSKILATSDGGTIITAGEDYTINTWSVEQIFCRQSQWNLELNSIGLGDHAKVKPQTSLVGHTHFITDIKITQKKHGILASCSIDKTCRIWNYSKGVQLMMISLESPVNCLALDPLEDFVFLGCKNHNVYSYRITQDKDVYNLALRDKVTGDPKLQLGKNLEKKTFVGHKEEVTAIAYYQEENMIITGGSNGKILFWSFDGNMVKQMNILTTGVNNIYMFKRPYEFDKNESFLKQKKRPFDIAIFKKYEEEKPSTDALLVPIVPNGEEIIQKKRRIDLVKEQTVTSQYISATFPMFGGKGRGEAGNAGPGAGGKGSEGNVQDDLKALREENEKLLKMNEKLFSMCFLKDKI